MIMEMNEVNQKIETDLSVSPYYEDFDIARAGFSHINFDAVAQPAYPENGPAAPFPELNLPPDYMGDILPDYGIPELGLKNPYHYGKDHPQVKAGQEHLDIPYLFQESRYIQEAWTHIDGTYSTHYAGSIQPTQVIIDAGHGTGFNIGNIIKYAKRYGKKEGYNRKDLLKIIHYAVMQLYVHDKEGL